MALLDEEWEDTIAEDLRALGRPVPTGLAGYESIDPVEAGLPDLPPEFLDAPTELVEAKMYSDEFVCTRCFLVQHKTRQGRSGDCIDCE